MIIAVRVDAVAVVANPVVILTADSAADRPKN